MTTTDKAETIRIGDVIMPPERELRVWMRKHVAERNLAETALHLHVEAIYKGKEDKNGPWLNVQTRHDPSWHPQGAYPFPFNFRVRPGTPWAIVERKAVAQ